MRFVETPSSPTSRSTALPPSQRRLVLGLWIGLLVVATPLLNCTGLRVADRMPALWNGLWYSGAALLAVWAALGDEPLARRLPRSFALAGLLMLGELWTHLRNTPNLANAPGQALFALYVFTFVGLLLALVRGVLGWRIGLPGRDAGPKTLQFSLRHLLLWMVGLALLLGGLRLLTPPALLDYIGYGFGWLILLAAIFAGDLLPLLWTSLALVLGGRQRWTNILVAGLSVGLFSLLLYVVCPAGGEIHLLVALAALLLVLLVFALRSRRGWPLALAWGLCVVLFPIPLNLYCPWIGAIWIGLGVVAMLLSTLFLVRLCGYRLLRRGDSPSPQEELPLTDSETTLPGRTRFMMLLTALVLLVAVAVWPIGELEAMRRVIARHQAIHEDWASVGASVRWDEQDRIVAVHALGSAPTTALFERLEELRHSETLVELLFPDGLRDEQMHLLSDRPFIQTLWLPNNPITDAGLAQLERLPQLRHLQLRKTQITDTSLEKLGTWKELEMLDLIDTQVSDAGLVHLGELTNLKHLLLAKTQVTPEGVRRLQAKLPHCRIDTTNPHP